MESKSKRQSSKGWIHLRRESENMPVTSECGMLGPDKRNRSRMTEVAAAVTCPHCLRDIARDKQS